MFDLFRSRDKLVRIMLGFILVVVAASMVTYLIPNANLGTTTNGNDTVLAEIAGRKLTQADFQRDFSAILQGNQINNPDQVAIMFPRFLEAEVHTLAMVYVAKEMGLTVPDDEVLTGLQVKFHDLAQNGVINKDQFEQYVASIGSTVQKEEDEVRDELLIKKLDDATLRGVVVTPDEVNAEIARRFDKAKIAYIAFPANKFVDEVKPTDEDLRKFYDYSKANYPVPEKRSFDVLVVDQDKVAATMTISDADLHKAYSESMDNFRIPERIHVRHILISTMGKSDSEKKALKAKADDILKQLKNGASFEELAKKDSDDKGSGEKGGDLDWIVKGQMQVPEFENAAFALKPMELSPVVTSSLGYHIIQVLAKEPARVKPFDEVKADLADELKKENLADKVQSIADQVRGALIKSPGSADQIAKQFGAELITVNDAAAGAALPGLGVSPEVDGALQGMKPNDVSGVLALPADRLAVVVLKSSTPARIATFDEVKDQVRQAFAIQKSKEIAAAKAKEAADDLRKGEDIDKVAKEFKLSVVTSSLFSGADSVEGLGLAAYVQDAFSKPVGSVLGPTEINGQNVVYKILEQVHADPSSYAAQKEAIVDALKRNKAQVMNELMEDSVITQLTNEGKLKINNDAIKALSTTYQPPSPGTAN